MNRYRFDPLCEDVIQSREADWLGYSGGPVRMRHGFELRLRPGCSYSKKRFVYRVAEAAEIEFFTRIFDRKTASRNFIDIGANIGYWTNAMCGLSHSVNVHSYEPDKVSFDILKSNVKNLPNVKIYNVGIGRRVAQTALFYDPADSGDSTLVPRPGRASYQVEITSLDEHAEGLHLEQVDFIKVDIQGGEVDFFLGASKTIMRNRPIMLVEVMNLVNLRLAKYISSFVARMNYVIFVVSNGTIDLVSREELLELRHDINVFLVPQEEQNILG